MSLIYNATFDSQTRVLSLLDKAGNVISSCEVPSKELVDDITKPLTFKATQDGSTVKLTKRNSPSGSFQTSRDGGKTWSNYTLGTAIALNTGDEVSFRAKSDRTSAQTSMGYFYFEMTGKIEAWHNVMSLYRTKDFATYDTVSEYAFYSLFDNCTSLVKAPALPATTLAQQCYSDMFFGCQSLTKAPELPATTLAGSCYSRMFKGCQSLTEAPVLPATTLASNCYYGMFLSCDRLNEVRCQLPSTISAGDVSKYTGSVTEAWLYSAPSTGTFYTNADANWPTGPSGIPYGWTRVNEEAPAVDDLTKPLTFRATQDGSTVKLSKTGSPVGTFQTSRDGGNTWEDYTLGTVITLNTGYEVSFRAKSDRTSAQNYNVYFQFNMTGKIEAWHNVMSLYRTNDFATYESMVKYAFYYLFKDCTSLTKAPELPATTLADHCYNSMFLDCTSLTEAPVLPATTLADYCYNGMFKGCTSLTKAPVLPVTTLATSCYSHMFNGCTSLTEAPALPATTLAKYCYYHMFDGCQSLTEAPALPATTLSDSCYQYMFYGCTSLAKAPELPATTLTTHCYKYMFYGCTSLTKAPELPATTLAAECYCVMFDGCTSLAEAPVLPATTLASKCYNSMFYGCTSLTKAPDLPATTLDTTCYSSMFYGCSSLTEAPELPATTLADRCYLEMFKGCTSLTKAPVLPSTTLADYCYQYMFDGCSSLNEVHCKIPSSISSSQISSYAEYWLRNVSSTGTFYTNADANWTSGASGIPTGWTRVNEGTPPVDNIRKPLTFKATQDGSSVRLTKNGSPDGSFQTSRDGGKTWTDYTLGTYINLNTGREVSFRAKSDRTSGQTVDNYFYFEMSGKIEAWHNVMSLYHTNVATYSKMVSHAFNSMFKDCTSLTKAPKLPATTLAHSCYRKMFEGCTALTEAPALPETTLAVACYWCMFNGCTSLTKAPELPATTLASSCYQYMFVGCTSLTKTPALSATTLADDCYQEMFRNCSSLNEVRCKIPSSYSSSAISSYAYNWLSGVSSKGTFYTNADANWPSGDDGIPQTWTRANIDDYPTT